MYSFIYQCIICDIHAIVPEAWRTMQRSQVHVWNTRNQELWGTFLPDRVIFLPPELLWLPWYHKRPLAAWGLPAYRSRSQHVNQADWLDFFYFFPVFVPEGMCNYLHSPYLFTFNWNTGIVLKLSLSNGSGLSLLFFRCLYGKWVD